MAEWFAELFGEHFYVEIQNNGVQIQKDCADGAIDIAARMGLPLVGTSDAMLTMLEQALQVKDQWDQQGRLIPGISGWQNLNPQFLQVPHA